MPSLSPAKTAEATDRELVFTRLFSAPIGVVFDVWTNPVHLPHWWGCNGSTTTVKEMDVRPGGICRLAVCTRDGRSYCNTLVFIEVDKPNRLVYMHESDLSGQPITAEITINFEPLGTKTRLTMRMLFPSAADRDYMVNTIHAEEGVGQSFDRMASHLDHMAESNIHLVVTRVFDAPRAVVFKAWTDPQQLAQWWGPHGFTTPVCEMDVRPGGKILIHMRGPDGVVYPLHGHYTEIVEPERLVFTGKVQDGGPRSEILYTVTFVEQSLGKTVLTIDHCVLNPTEASTGILAGAKIGWTQMLERLAVLVESESRS